MRNMDKTRKAEIDWCLDHETSEPETQEWREELTAEESAYVQARDKHYERGIAALCSAILVRERVRQRYRPEEIAELETRGDHCRLRLRSGETFFARWSADGGLRLEKIVRERSGDSRCSA